MEKAPKLHEPRNFFRTDDEERQERPLPRAGFSTMLWNISGSMLLADLADMNLESGTVKRRIGNLPKSFPTDYSKGGIKMAIDLQLLPWSRGIASGQECIAENGAECAESAPLKCAGKYPGNNRVNSRDPTAGE